MSKSLQLFGLATVIIVGAFLLHDLTPDPYSRFSLAVAAFAGIVATLADQQRSIERWLRGMDDDKKGE